VCAICRDIEKLCIFLIKKCMCPNNAHNKQGFFSLKTIKWLDLIVETQGGFLGEEYDFGGLLG
jgi:hypothetical protein